MCSRYDLNKPILVVSTLLEEEGVITTPPSPTAAILRCLLNDIPVDNITFVFREIIPTEEHTVPIEYTEDRTAKGYKAISPTPVLEGINFEFSNQYPVAHYGQLSTSADNIWSLYGEENTDWCKLVINAKVPYRYQTAESLLGELDSSSSNNSACQKLILKLIEMIKKDWPDYHISKKEWMNSGVSFYRVKHIKHY